VQYDAALLTQDELRGQLAELTVNLETEKANSERVAELEILIAELQTNLEAAEAIEVTDAATEAKVELEEGIYFLIEDVPLGGNFGNINGIDNDDLSILSYSDVEYNDDTIDFEEKLYFTVDFKPELNVEDFGSEILVGMANEGAIKYMLEFDDPIVFVADEELDIEFLGQAYTLVNYSGGELTFRVSDKYEGSYGDEFEVDGQIVKILEIDGDGEKVRIQVGDETEVIKLDDEREVGGLSIYVDDVFVATIPEDMAWVSLYIGEDIVQEVYDTDEFMETEDWEWVIIDDDNGDGNLTSLGVVYTEKLNDEDEYWHLADGMCFPLDYVCVEFLEVKNAEVTDLKMDLSNSELDVTFDGKIEIGGDRIDDAKFSVDLDTLVFEYKYKGEGKDSDEEDLVFDDIVFFVEDRELGFEMDQLAHDFVRVFDVTHGTQDYKFWLNPGEFYESRLDAKDMNDDENFRVELTGDILYTSEINKDDNDDKVEIGLVSDEALEVILKVN